LAPSPAIAGRRRSTSSASIDADRPQLLWWCASLLIATLIAYQPAWHGTLLWDDDAHLTRPELQSTAGLWRIWFDLGATQQYYPVVHSAFWLMHRLFGDATLGYHLVTIVLHVAAAGLAALVLRRLAVPGALLAATLFALHPVQVESVAWMTELKNTLSGVFYFGAALTYLRFDRTRSGRAYTLASALFVLALLSKTVTATLPGALLVVFWWRRGRLNVRRDIGPLLPWLAAGIAAGIGTAWVERAIVGAEGASYQLTMIERVLVAGRALWFYLGAIVWPVNLAFIPPKWAVDAARADQYLYPAAVLAVIAALWWLRGRSRAPLAAALYFGGTLFPALGFLNVYPFRYSYVASHFQYLAGLGVMASAAAAATIAVGRLEPAARRAAALGGLAVCVLLGVLTWRESRTYADAETLYRTTISRNPTGPMAYINLAILDLQKTPPAIQEATALLETAVRLDPANPDGHTNLGHAYETAGRFGDAEREYRERVRLAGQSVDGHRDLGRMLLAINRPAEGAEELRAAQRLGAADGSTHYLLASTLMDLGRVQESVLEFQAALGDDRLARSPELHNDLGVALVRLGRMDEARAQFSEALRIDPTFAAAAGNLRQATQPGASTSKIKGR